MLNHKFETWVALTTLLLGPVLVSCIDDSFVVTTDASERAHPESDKGENDAGTITPKIYLMEIESNITNRFARTLIKSKVRNLNNVAREATFSVILPDKAFISEFVMEIGGKSYKAYVKEKEEAKQIYDQAVSSGVGAAHVAASARDSNRFTVSTNIEAHSKATFLLTYEELLRRKEDKYEQVINIHPKQPVKDLFVTVAISESKPLKFVNAPPIRSGNDIKERTEDVDPRADVIRINETTAIVRFSPTIERQKELAKNLGTSVDEGLSGQFVVQYDVEREENGGQVLLLDGYFVHFFAPSYAKPLNKFILFVLDTSGSMYDSKMKQLKEAMHSILDQLDNKDFFHIIGFESNTKVWDINNHGASVNSPRFDRWFMQDNDNRITESSFPYAFAATPSNISSAKRVVSDFYASGGTNIYEALKVALYLINREKEIHNEFFPQPMIMFLTDGDPTVGHTSREKIVSDITKGNDLKVPIYSLSFGSYADKKFLKELSLKNSAFSRHIYEASDAALQLENFYKEIASPLLSDVKFEYVPETTSLTKTAFPIHFKGSELIVAGRLDFPQFPVIPRVTCKGIGGPKILEPVIETPVTSLERLWAYLTVQQLLEEKEVAANKTVNEKKALDLALKYSFVTPVSSLVVVKPNSTDSDVNTEAADTNKPDVPYNRGVYGVPRVPSMTLNSKVYMAARHHPVAMRGGVSVPFLAGMPGRPVQFVKNTLDFDLAARPSSSDKLTKLKLALPWLENVLNDDGTFKPQVGHFKLGLNETITTTPPCGNTPSSSSGVCKLLHDCPQVHHLLPTVEIFISSFCKLDEFAGVCCPVSSHAP